MRDGKDVIKEEPRPVVAPVKALPEMKKAKMESPIHNKTAVKKSSLMQTHQKQLVSETADLKLDAKDAMKQRVPLESRGDALYLGTIFLGSPQS
eukprot:CAMPEP_0170487830 /NCGR_PEP_ID=MMETSP0208-20121228/6557_1 /TAXON_ID=197538 /ORGANISM="Strombidium inclinatum, Strain S3" /LENGTH=93 /DNA_ID=CAMNT_0010762239 /DNA_START=227 /DNA_END=508 /DNA_ORIENTATION=-